MIFGFSVLGLFVIFISVIIIRAILFKPLKETIVEPTQISVDRDKATHDLAQMIKCRTVSDMNKSLEDNREFEKFKELLPTLFPNVYSVCEYEEPSDRALQRKPPVQPSIRPALSMSAGAGQKTAKPEKQNSAAMPVTSTTAESISSLASGTDLSSKNLRLR